MSIFATVSIRPINLTRFDSNSIKWSIRTKIEMLYTEREQIRYITILIIMIIILWL